MASVNFIRGSPLRMDRGRLITLKGDYWWVGGMNGPMRYKPLSCVARTTKAMMQAMMQAMMSGQDLSVVVGVRTPVPRG